MSLGRHQQSPSLSGGLLGVLGFLACVGPFAVDIYLPSFSSIAEDLHASPAEVQLTLTTFLLGIGAGQMILGPLSDRHGRRRVLLYSLTLFATSTIAIVFAPSIWILILLRALQGLSGAGGMVIARAIAVDLSFGQTAVHALSMIATVIGLGPLIAPPIGGVLETIAGWRGVFAFVSIIAVAQLAITFFLVPESLPVAARHTTGFRGTIGNFRTLLRDRIFVFYLVAFSFGMAAIMSYISASPFVGQEILRMSPLVYSLAFACGALALTTANFINSRLAVRVGPRRMLVVGVILGLAGGIWLTAITLTGHLSIPGFVLGAFIVSGGAGLTMSNANALALARTNKTNRGAGAALCGTSQFWLGSLATPLVGLWGEHTALPMALGITASMLIAVVMTLIANGSRAAD